MPGFLFKLLESINAFIKELVKSFTLRLIFVPFLLKLLEVDSEMFIFFQLKFIIFFDFPVGSQEG